MYMWTNLSLSHESMHNKQYDQVALLYDMYKVSYYNQKLFFTFPMPLKWVAIIGYM